MAAFFTAFAAITFLYSVDCKEGRFQEFPQYDGGACLEEEFPQCNRTALYRTYDGSCSSLGNPSWGMAKRTYIRTRPPVYADGKSSPRLAADGSPLPNARTISENLFLDEPEKVDRSVTHFLMAWGQLIAHDVTQKGLAFASVNRPCCTADFQMLPKESLPEDCLPVEVKDDEFYSQFSVKCLSFYRATAFKGKGCAKFPREQINNVTQLIDGSFLYGSDEKTAKAMRAFVNGKLKVDVSKQGRPYLTNDAKPAIPCQNPRSELKCYFAGDERVNQNPGLEVLTTIFLRAHNHLCHQMVAINPHWSDEIVYQEVRRLVGALLQKITYKDYLPVLLGEDFVKRKGLLGESGCVNFHDPSVNPAIYHEFSGAAFRSFHSLVARKFIFVNKRFKENGFIHIDDYMFRPSLIEYPEAFDELMRGMAEQPCPKMDQHISVGLTNYFFKQNRSYGGDLEIFDIQCGRDMGIAPYPELHQLCGGGKVEDFDDLSGVMSKESIWKLRKLYPSVYDIDAFVGGMMENVIGTTMAGPTFRCVIGEQFHHLMKGDRFYYENCGSPWSFTPEQIQAIRRTSAAWMFCVAGDDVDRIQLDVFHQPSPKNPIQSCKDIPALDLSAWKQLI